MSPQQYQRLIGSDPVLEMMVRRNVPLTRDNYVDIANAGRPDEAWTLRARGVATAHVFRPDE